MKRCLRTILCLLLLSVFFGCGSGGDEVDASNLSAEDEESTLAVIQVSMLWSSFAQTQGALALTAPRSKAEIGVPCAQGGTVTISDDGSTFTFIGCSDGTTQTDGTLTLSESTLSFDLTTVDLNGRDITIIGTVGAAKGLIVWDITGAIGVVGESGATLIHTTGNLTSSDTGEVSGTLTADVNDVEVTCTFNGLNPVTATQGEYTRACGL